ncbi:MAG: nucleotidyltransferase domain-containing protein [Candidatus Aenigmarchaeota archaeon]|nr:nucleotidyltransferase domain-containing protein [Candidatus Aenigmarchaeota archaeon]
MVREKPIIRELRTFKKELSRDFPVEKIILFGSLATGRAHEDSDVDLIIVSPKFRGMGFFKRGASMYDYWTIRKPVDFLCYTPEEFKKLSKGVTIVREAEEHGIEIN